MKERLVNHIYNQTKVAMSASSDPTMDQNSDFAKDKEENCTNEGKTRWASCSLMLFLDSFFHWNPDFPSLAKGPVALKKQTKISQETNPQIFITYINTTVCLLQTLPPHWGLSSKKNNSHFVTYRIRISARDYGSNLSLMSVKLNHECWLSGSQELLQAFCHHLPEEADSLQISTAAGLAFPEDSASHPQAEVLHQCAIFSHLKRNIGEHCCSLKEQKEPVALLQLFRIPDMQLQPREQMFTPVESRRMDWWAEPQFH